MESPEYEGQYESLAQIYSDEMLEFWLLGILWGIATNPAQYNKATGNIYLAKSRSFDAGPCFRVLFEIIDENKVGPLWIEETGGTDELMEF